MRNFHGITKKNCETYSVSRNFRNRMNFDESNCDKIFFCFWRFFPRVNCQSFWHEVKYIIKYHYEKRTTIVSWCFPSNGKNSRMHTSKLPEFTFSNQTYMASLGFVSRVYLAETNTAGLPPKLYNAFISFQY